MTGQLRTSRAGLDLIRSFEGFRETSIRLPDGRWTVGHGHVRTAREGIRISEDDALELLQHDLKSIEDGVAALVYAPLNQNQFDALVSLAFNISLGEFRDSDILEALNAGDDIAAAGGFDAWRKARVNGRMIIVDALVRRRAAEKALFLEPMEARPTAPTPIVTPLRDAGAPAPLAREIEEPPGYDPLPEEAEEDVPPQRSAELDASDIASAVADLADRLGPSQLRRSPLEANAQQQQAAPAKPTTPSQAAAQRLSRILSRVDDALRQSPPQNKPPTSPPREVPLDLPDLSSPTERDGGKTFIDDTEIVAPHGSPDDVFSAALEEEKRVQNRRRAATTGRQRILWLAPWFAISILCALGLGVATVETTSAENPNNLLGGAAPTMIAVFGLLLAISGYYILRRLSDED